MASLVDDKINGMPALSRIRLRSSDWSLRTQMMVSYTWVTLASVLVLQTLAFAINGIALGQVTWQLLRDSLVVLVVTVPVGGLFSLIVTRPLVRRVRSLVSASNRFGQGQYDLQVPITGSDEIGHLEAQFNRMAEQIATGLAERQSLAEQNARLAERARLSRELHDSISQDLFSLRTLADGLYRSAETGRPARDLLPQIEIVEQTTQSIAREMRALLLEMRPPQLEHLDLPGALAELAEAYRSRVGLTINTVISPLRMGTAAEQGLLRIAQEALGNAARHANATAIQLELARMDNEICLTVADNGQGLAPEQESHPHGLGLQSMRERAQALGGKLILDSAPGCGTRVQVVIPAEPAT